MTVPTPPPPAPDAEIKNLRAIYHKVAGRNLPIRIYAFTDELDTSARGAYLKVHIRSGIEKTYAILPSSKSPDQRQEVLAAFAIANGVESYLESWKTRIGPQPRGYPEDCGPPRSLQNQKEILLKWVPAVGVPVFEGATLRSAFAPLNAVVKGVGGHITYHFIQRKLSDQSHYRFGVVAICTIPGHPLLAYASDPVFATRGDAQEATCVIAFYDRDLNAILRAACNLDTIAQEVASLDATAARAPTDPAAPAPSSPSPAAPASSPVNADSDSALAPSAVADPDAETASSAATSNTVASILATDSKPVEVIEEKSTSEVPSKRPANDADGPDPSPEATPAAADDSDSESPPPVKRRRYD